MFIPVETLKLVALLILLVLNAVFTILDFVKTRGVSKTLNPVQDSESVDLQEVVKAVIAELVEKTDNEKKENK